MEFENRRRHPRYEVPYTVAECALIHAESEVNFIGLICNYSEGGVCIHTSQPLSIGERISIQSENPKLSQTATVRWFKDESVSSYRIGLEFI
jgi:hypothetical protein